MGRWGDGEMGRWGDDSAEAEATFFEATGGECVLGGVEDEEEDEDEEGEMEQWGDGVGFWFPHLDGEGWDSLK
jgi:hypothetical protein